jgi:hypothetical protein
VPILSLICLAMVRKACSTFEAFLAEVSRKGIPRLSANSYMRHQHSHTVRHTIFGWVMTTTDLCDSVFDNFLVRHIALVSNKQFIYTLRCVSVNLLQPLLDIVERVHVCDIVDNADAVCATIVRRGNCSETLLSSRIPLSQVRNQRVIL